MIAVFLRRRAALAYASTISFFYGSTYLEILDKALQERDKVLGFSYIARDCFFQHVTR
jgi:hypothetical protein